MTLLATVRNGAGGRIPPVTRLAILCGFGIFFVGLLVFKPVAGGAPTAPALTSGAQLLPSGSALAETQALLDPSAVYLPATTAKPSSSLAEAVQPEDSPLAGFEPILRFTPGKVPDLTLETAKAVAITPSLAVPLVEWEPFTTLGRAKLTQDAITPRGLYFEVFPLSAVEKCLIKGKVGNIIIKDSQSGAINAKSPPQESHLEMIIGIDSMGLQSPGVVVRSSGNPGVDAAIRAWSAQVDWAKRLPPGSYRLNIGP